MLEVGGTKTVAKACGENFHYIAGNGVRIRKTPGGVALGAAWYWERVNLGARNGSWQYVTFYQRTSGIRAGWVAAQYVEFHQPTCP
ncbi:hypothetical protein AOZ06_05140 [Kibdelosporangium phytohabitans]|uniref:SH3b domain-containing protein n=1 Tax=Kibdelosporangium phytohabitans TaxID=860235 RepID=A0A0N9HSV0_9PSEU|nr:hypothetical protein AOZ06_05140 [Kibdelosporangium phytohabitans]